MTETKQNTNPQNILVIGSGGREHAIIHALKKSADKIANLYAYPANAGIAQDCTVADIKSSSNADILSFCQSSNIDLVIIGPEQPLVDGLSDFLNANNQKANNLKVFGPSQYAAQIEGSKDFMKALVAKYNIPTAQYQTFTDKQKAIDYVKNRPTPIVIKTDGLAAGKGVVICETNAQALTELDEYFAGKFGAAGQKVVIEDFLEGEEISFFVVTDGISALEVGSAQDHKRAYDGDKGPNTGGMGTYSPAPIVTPALKQKIMERVIAPTIAAFKAENIDYKGFLFAGFMVNKNGDPYLLEYNIRFGDPEAQSVLPRLKTPLLDIINATVNQTLSSIKEIEFNPVHALCVVLAAEGYPNTYKKGMEINTTKATQNAIIFHAGTSLSDGKIISTGGRVLAVTGLGETLQQAADNAYSTISKIDFPNSFYRKDIGYRALNK